MTDAFEYFKSDTPETTFKVYQMNDCDWYVAQNPEAATAAFIEMCGERSALDKPHELTEAELDSKFIAIESDVEGELPKRRTFREQLAFDAPTKAGFFASTEF